MAKFAKISTIAWQTDFKSSNEYKASEKFKYVWISKIKNYVYIFLVSAHALKMSIKRTFSRLFFVSCVQLHGRKQSDQIYSQYNKAHSPIGFEIIPNDQNEHNKKSVYEGFSRNFAK